MTQQEFEHIIPELHSSVMRIGNKFFRNSADAEDVAQETLLLTWKYCPLLHTKRDATALALRIAKRLCVDVYRRRRRTVPLEREVGETGESSYAADHEVRAAEARRELESVLQQMNPRHGELLRWQVVDEVEMTEIIRRSGLKESSVMSMLSTARNLLLRELKKRF